MSDANSKVVSFVADLGFFLPRVLIELTVAVLCSEVKNVVSYSIVILVNSVVRDHVFWAPLRVSVCLCTSLSSSS